MIHGLKLTDFGEIPISWDIKQINEVTTYVDYRGKTPAKVNSGILLITARNIKMGKIDYDVSQEYIPTELYETVMRRGIPKLGDVLITTEAPLGNIASIDNENIALAQRVIKYRGKKDVLDNGYLKYFMLGSIFQNMLDKQSSGSTVKGIKGSILHKLKLIVPPLPEQKKIVEILSTVDDKIEVIDQQITENQELKRGLMQRLLTKGIGHTEFKDSPLGMIPESWDVKILKEECNKINVGFVGTCEKFYCEKNEGVLMIRTGNLSNGKIKYSNLKYVTHEFHNKNTKSKIFEGDLLIARHGSSGQAVLVPKKFEESNCLNIIIIRPKTTLNPEFLKFQFNSNIIKEQVRKKTAGSTQGVVNTKEIATLIILHPPLPEQNKIANILNSIDDKLEVLLEKKTHYQELKQGLMQQLLTGKIRVKV